MSPATPTPPAGATFHLRPTAPAAERVLLPGDPGRALMLAQSLLSEPRMFNHHRGLWGYTGTAADGGLVTIQATGMGGPSAAIVLRELIELGSRRAVRVGTCGALDPELRLGALVVAREAVCGDGTSRALGAGARMAADPSLTAALAEAAPTARVGTVETVDLFYGGDGLRDGRWRAVRGGGGPPRAVRGGGGPTTRSRARTRARGTISAEESADPPSLHDGGEPVAVEMEAAALFALGAAASIPVGCLVTVSDVFDSAGRRTRIDDHALAEAATRMGQVALRALS